MTAALACSSRRRIGGLVVGLLGLAVLLARPVSAAETLRRHVLILQSSGSQASPFADFTDRFRQELLRQSSSPIEFSPTPLDMLQTGEFQSEGPFVEYLQALFENRRIDLVVSVGTSAALFCVRHREELFPGTPLLLAAASGRGVPEQPPNSASAGMVALDFRRMIADGLDLLPATEVVAVVFGASPRERALEAEMRQQVEPLAARVRFEWWSDLELDQMVEKAASMPPKSMIFYGMLTLDRAGFSHEKDSALDRLAAASRVPLLGAFDYQLGRGILGGELFALGDLAREAASAAVRLMEGEAVDSFPIPAAESATYFDSRQLTRFRIPESRLPPDATILFRPPSVWEEHRGALLAGLLIVGLQAAMIGGLLVQGIGRRRAEREARGLSRRLLTVHEEERRLLARELHDDLSQRIARLSIDAGRLSQRTEKVENRELLGGIQAELGRMSEDIHTISYGLHSSVLEHLGLTEALQVECEEFSSRHSLPVALHAPDHRIEMSREVALCFYRVAQEALRNVARHAHATRVELTLSHDGKLVRMSVVDDGRGFDAARQSVRPSLGLLSMKERASLAGATLKIQSKPGHGTSIVLEGPPDGTTKP